mmetsp:Transcript_45050/g.86145  ORF Transcript_45050/g.86145 Transcript_45050/m.86145 type:complete len:227 (-) Transcript_45050:124-804(-)
MSDALVPSQTSASFRVACTPRMSASDSLDVRLQLSSSPPKGKSAEAQNTSQAERYTGGLAGVEACSSLVGTAELRESSSSLAFESLSQLGVVRSSTLSVSCTTSKSPTTSNELSLTTGKCKKCFECIRCNASFTLVDGSIVSGMCVITSCIRVISGLRAAATTRYSRSLVVKMPTSLRWPSSITSTPPLPLLCITFAASVAEALMDTHGRASPSSSRSVPQVLVCS